MKTFKSNGKLLITGEYVVLDGAKALAIPTKYGQRLTIENYHHPNTILWKSINEKNELWFEGTFHLNSSEIITAKDDNPTSLRLVQILNAAKALNPDFLKSDQGFSITTHLDFNRNWGLGTSSTLINNIARWANIDAYQLLADTFGGSGYDIACAQSDKPLSYQIVDTGMPTVETVSFNPDFKKHLYFVYLNQKQNSRDGIKAFRALDKSNSTSIEAINRITDDIIECQSLSDFENLVNRHEAIISELIQQPTIKSSVFKDFDGSIKSLGAWGGDFILVSSTKNPKDYFRSKGFDTIISYEDMALK